MKIKFKFFSISLIAVIGMAGVYSTPASATHENDHRFTVHGRVLDDQGAASSRTSVVAKDDKETVLETTKTASDGSYKMVLHLHDSDLGKELIIIANKVEKKLKVNFNRSDKKSERRAEVNFGASQNIGKRPNKGAIMGGIAFVVLAIGAYFVYSGRNKKEQQEQKKADKKLKAKKGKSKKKKR